MFVYSVWLSGTTVDWLFIALITKTKQTKTGAVERTWTSTPETALPPQISVSTNSTTTALAQKPLIKQWALSSVFGFAQNGEDINWFYLNLYQVQQFFNWLVN